MKDFLGQDIKAGDIVVYPNRQASSMWMTKARVVEVRDDSLRVQRDVDGLIKPIICVDRIVVVTKQLEQTNAAV